MALRDLIFNIRADNKAAPAISAIRKDLQSTSGAAATLSDRINRASKSLTAMGAAGSVVSLGLGRIFRDSLSLYDTQAKAEAKIEQAIRATGGAAGFTAAQLKAQASALQDVSRYGDEDILANLTAPLLSFGSVTDDVFTKAQRTVLDLSAYLQTDLKSTALQVGKALQDPVKGISALTRVGVSFTEAQKDFIESLVETGRAAEAQNVILDAILGQGVLGQAQAEARAGLGALAQLSNAWGDVKEVVGSVVADYLPPLVGAMKSAVKWLQELSPATQRFVVVAGALAIALPPVTLAVGALGYAVTALTGPVGIAVAGFGLLAGAAAALLAPSAAAAGAMDNEARASAELSEMLATGVGLSRETAAIKKHEAEGRLTNAQAALTEARAVYASAMAQAQSQSGRNLRGTMFRADNAAEDVAALEETVATIEANIAKMDEIAAGSGNVVTLPEIDLSGVTRAAQGLRNQATETADTVEEESERAAQAFGRDMASIVRQSESVGDAFERLRTRITDAVLDAALSPAFEQLGKSVSGALSGAAGGSGGSGRFLSSLLSLGGSAIGLPGFATGGAFTVGGRAGRDRQPVALALSRGERVEVTPRGQSSAAQVVVNIQTPDPRAFAASRAQIGRTIGRAVAAGQRGA